MRGITVVELIGVNDAQVKAVVDSLGIEVMDSALATRPGWIAYTLKSTTLKYKITPVPGYTFLGMNFSKGKDRATSKWKATHPQTFPEVLYKPLLRTVNLTTETWYDLVRKLLEAGARGVKANKRQFSSLTLFQRYCDDLGIWRIIQAERGLNK
jgi:hypothetical protein